MCVSKAHLAHSVRSSRSTSVLYILYIQGQRCRKHVFSICCKMWSISGNCIKPYLYKLIIKHLNPWSGFIQIKQMFGKWVKRMDKLWWSDMCEHGCIFNSCSLILNGKQLWTICFLRSTLHYPTAEGFHDKQIIHTWKISEHSHHSLSFSLKIQVTLRVNSFSK